ncbi:hypothetical protein WDV93_22850 [Pantoea ananatis]
MSEYSEVEKAFLDQLAEQGWTVIDQGSGTPRSRRGQPAQQLQTVAFTRNFPRPGRSGH